MSHLRLVKPEPEVETLECMECGNEIESSDIPFCSSDCENDYINREVSNE